MKPSLQKNTKLIGILGVLFMTFGITYFDFEEIQRQENLKPLIMILIGLTAVIYFLYLKKGSKS